MTSKAAAAEMPRKKKKRSQARDIWRRLTKNKVVVVAMIIIAILLFISIFAGILVNYETQVIQQNISERLQSPSGQHLMGTDGYGRDLFSRILYGARVSMIIALCSTLCSVVVGCAIGAAAGYYGGKTDNIIMRLLDIILAIPQVLFCIAIIATLGPGVRNLIIALAVAGTPAFARVMRSSILTLRDNEYVEAARAVGARDITIIMRHILPNAIGPIIVQATMYIAGMIISAAGLSYVGLGVSPPQPEWGSMLAEAQEFMRNKVYLILFPGLAIVISSLSFNILGDGFRDALDPRLRGVK